MIFPQGIINSMLLPAFKTVAFLISGVDLIQSERTKERTKEKRAILKIRSFNC